jgi:poly-beta-1,6-N-acetyl-D-glucosamine synthase
MRIVATVLFLNEERYLPALLQSLAEQTRPPDRLLLVDDGSTDTSAELAEAFAREYPYAKALHRPPRTRERDRLAAAAELSSFTWALESFDEPWDIAAKLDADLRLAPGTFAAMEARFRKDPHLGIAGPGLLSLNESGRDVSHHTRPEHADGATKFYRRACFEQIAPIPPILGWDTIDEVRAQMRGWRTAGGVPGEDPVVHLRPMGAHDGPVRAFLRWGACAYGYGEHPLHVVLTGIRRMREPPVVAGGIFYVVGWALAALRRAPRAEPELRAFVRRGQLRRMLRRASGRSTRPDIAAGA